MAHCLLLTAYCLLLVANRYQSINTNPHEGQTRVSAEVTKPQRPQATGCDGPMGAPQEMQLGAPTRFAVKQ
jgi:hypothetical protein